MKKISASSWFICKDRMLDFTEEEEEEEVPEQVER